MKIFEYTNDNFKIQVVCDSFETRNSWGHVAHVILNDDEMRWGECKRYYYNRTWERYQYQSVLLDAIDNGIVWYDTFNKIQFKNMNNIQRMTKKRQEEYKQFKGAFNEYIEFLEDAYKHFSEC